MTDSLTATIRRLAAFAFALLVVTSAIVRAGAAREAGRLTVEATPVPTAFPTLPPAAT